MKTYLLFITLIISFSSCISSDEHSCTCVYKNIEEGTETIRVDTIKNLNKEDASIQCSNYQTTDDPNEPIICSLGEL